MEGLNQFFQTRAAEAWIALAFLVLVMELWILLLHRRIARLQETLKAPRVPPLPLSGNEHAAIAELQSLMPRALQRVGIVRYSAYDDTGGDQSFALCVADADGNGLVMSSLYRRNESRVFAKPLAAWQSTYTLSDEEGRAIGRARGDAEPEAEPHG